MHSKYAYKILQIIFLRVFKFPLVEFCAKSVKINAPQILPLISTVGETGVSWHVFQKNAHKTQESLISGMSDVLVKR